MANHRAKNLPRSLKSTEQDIGAIEIFKASHWFNERINQIQNEFSGDIKKALNKENIDNDLPEKLGDTLKSCILEKYQQDNEFIY